MQRNISAETEERLLRLIAPRRGRAIELRVHYEVSHLDECTVYRIITIDEPCESTITD